MSFLDSMTVPPPAEDGLYSEARRLFGKKLSAKKRQALSRKAKKRVRDAKKGIAPLAPRRPARPPSWRWELAGYIQRNGSAVVFPPKGRPTVTTERAVNPVATLESVPEESFREALGGFLGYELVQELVNAGNPVILRFASRVPRESGKPGSGAVAILHKASKKKEILRLKSRNVHTATFAREFSTDIMPGARVLVSSLPLLKLRSVFKRRQNVGSRRAGIKVHPFFRCAKASCTKKKKTSKKASKKAAKKRTSRKAGRLETLAARVAAAAESDGAKSIAEQAAEALGMAPESSAPPDDDLVPPPDPEPEESGGLMEAMGSLLGGGSRALPPRSRAPPDRFVPG